MSMNEKQKQEEKLIIALRQLANLSSLLEGNEYETYIAQRLISVECELSRQLHNLQS